MVCVVSRGTPKRPAGQPAEADVIGVEVGDDQARELPAGQEASSERFPRCRAWRRWRCRCRLAVQPPASSIRKKTLMWLSRNPGRGAATVGRARFRPLRLGRALAGRESEGRREGVLEVDEASISRDREGKGYSCAGRHFCGKGAVLERAEAWRDGGPDKRHLALTETILTTFDS